MKQFKKRLQFNDQQMVGLNTQFDDSYFKFIDAKGTQQGRPLGNSYAVPTRDGTVRFVDSTGAFMVGELEKLDLTMHEPLALVSWGRDIDLREDVTIADDVSSFTLTNFASQGGLGSGNSVGNGKAWLMKNTNNPTSIQVDINKIPHALHPWGMELSYSIFELESAAKLGRPIDTQKFEALQLKHQMDIDEQVYIGDSSLGAYGLINNNYVTNVSNVVNGVSGFSNWMKKQPTEILADFNAAITSVWAATGYALMPNRVLIPPALFGYLSQTIISQAGDKSILRYILENNVTITAGSEYVERGFQLRILPCKWLVGAGGSSGASYSWANIGVSGNIDRMVVYVKDYKRVRFPMTLIQRTPVQYDSLFHKTNYFCRLGEVEVVYPESIGYFDGI